MGAAIARRLRAAEIVGDVRPSEKITFAEMHDSGVRGILVYCADYRCSQPFNQRNRETALGRSFCL